MRSTDTWHGRPKRAAVVRRGREHAFRAARVDRDRLIGGSRATSAPFERRDDASAFAALPSSVVSTSVTPSVAEPVEVEQLRGAPRAVEQRRRRRRGRPALRRASRTARGRRRRRPSTLRSGGSTSVNGRPSGPRHAIGVAGARVVEQRRSTPMRLLRIETPVGVPSRVAQDLEDRERAAEQRIVPRRRPSPSRTGPARRRRRSRARRARARCSRPTAACWRSRPRTRRRASGQYNERRIAEFRLQRSDWIAGRASSLGRAARRVTRSSATPICNLNSTICNSGILPLSL